MEKKRELCRLLIMISITVIAESLTFRASRSFASASGQTDIGAAGPRLQYTAKENLPQPFQGFLFAGPSQLECPRRNISSSDVPIEFSENDVLNPELVGKWGAMEATKKMVQSCAKVKSVLVDENKGMR